MSKKTISSIALVAIPILLLLTVAGRLVDNPVLETLSIYAPIPIFILALILAPVQLAKGLLILFVGFLTVATTAFIPAWLYAEFLFKAVDNNAVDVVVILSCLAIGITAGFIAMKKLNKALGNPYGNINP